MTKQEFRFQTNLPSPARRGSRSRPPLRRPRSLRFERLRVPVWNPYSRGRLSPAKSEDRKGGEGKTDANLTIFFSTCCASHPNSPPRPGEALHPAPSARKSATRTAQKTALCAPASTQEVRNPKIGQQLGAQPTPRFRVMIEAMIEAMIQAMIDPLPPFTFCCPQAI